jgi:hypothetical protein
LSIVPIRVWTLGAFAVSADAQTYISLIGMLDGHGNLGASTEYFGSISGGDLNQMAGHYSLALQQVSDSWAVSYRTEARDGQNSNGDPSLSSSNPRLSDHLDQVDFVRGTTLWKLPLAMRRLVQLRVDSTGDTFVVGVLQDSRGTLDVRKVSGTGVTEWAVTPPPSGVSFVGFDSVDSVDSIVSDVAPDGGLVVGWNLTPIPDAGGRVLLQRFSNDGASCTARVVPGTATDVAVLADGSILVATNDAISRYGP